MNLKNTLYPQFSILVSYHFHLIFSPIHNLVASPSYHMLPNLKKVRDMKGMKSRLHINLKLIPTIDNLKQGLILQLNPQDVCCIQKCSDPTVYDYQDHKAHNMAELEIGLNRSEDDKHYEEKEIAFEVTQTNGSKEKELVERNLVASSPYKSIQSIARIKEYPSLTDFEEIYPPGGSQEVIFYTTSMRGIRKTFQDCNTVRFLLKSFKIKYYERDVSLHLEFREELWKILGGKVIPPKLFIRGRYIGGADEVVGLHEMGWLGKLLEGTPSDFADGPCKVCACMKFAICANCNGSCKVFTFNGDNKNECFIRCPECNENGLVKCPICC